MKAVSLLLVSLFGAAPRGEVLEFSSRNCGPCQQMAPIVSRLLRDGQPIRAIDVAQDPGTAQRHNVSLLPTFLLIVDGQEVERITGAQSEDRIRQMLARIPSGTATPTASPIAIELGEPTSQPQPRPRSGEGVIAEASIEQPETRSGVLGEFPRLFRRTPKPQPEIRGQDQELGGSPSRSGEAAYAASMRIVVTAGGTKQLGSGTVIDSRAGRTTVLTSASLFAQHSDAAKIEVSVPGTATPRTYVGRLLAADYDADVGIVAINTDAPLPSAAIAPAERAPAVGMRVVSIGANDGQELVRQQTRVTAVNKYSGPDNLECAGLPLQGRCGGGLFNDQGELVGICVASGEAPDTGMYAGLLAIHDVLRKNGLESLIAPAAAARPMIASAEIDLGEPSAAPSGAEDLFANPDVDLASYTSMEGPAPGNGSGSPLSGVRDEDLEVVVVLRNRKSPDAASKVMVIHRASPKTMALLRGELNPSAGTAMARSGDSRSAADAREWR
ncbi:MAG: trypsin-like peptidase domain-containing protein [Planctomyces sp.]|nr:trypsin-like peptidase domain-containing protein [Planctomyces sp.]